LTINTNRVDPVKHEFFWCTI